MAGVGPLEIPLEEDYRAKDWTIQLRWPVSMNDVECFSDKIVEMDCGGKGRILKIKTIPERFRLNSKIGSLLGF